LASVEWFTGGWDEGASVRVVGARRSRHRSPQAAQVGLRILQSGGSAVDASVAATVALGVVEPMTSGIGGDLFAMLWSASDQQAQVFDGSGRSARAASLDALHERGHRSVPVSGCDGVLSVSVPGAVNAWAEILAERGTITLDAALAPAIDLASRGFPVPKEVAASWGTGGTHACRP
jgi:gamma-glutamyltranspeptidase/glutathione hydrolase